MKKTVYILGPMSGYLDYNRPAFHAAAKVLRADGFNVINPAEIDDAMGEPKEYTDYYARDLRFLPDADGAYALPGWERSKGATAEAFIIGRLLGRSVFRQGMVPIHPKQLPNLVIGGHIVG